MGTGQVSHFHLRELLLSLKDAGKTILLASHGKEDIAILCDTVTELDQGRVITTTARA
jgi:ABC-2 type transport system ATP-binding protein